MSLHKLLTPGPGKEQSLDIFLNAISQVESSSNTDPNRLTPNSDGALGEFQITPPLYKDIQRLYPETIGISFKEAALGPMRREIAKLGLLATQRNLETEGVASTRDAVIQAYHSGARNTARGTIGKEGKDYLRKINNILGE